MNILKYLVFILCLLPTESKTYAQKAFPYILPKEKPNRPLSTALNRLYTNYPAPKPEDNELYSQFRYTKLEGFDYHNFDGTITRRDPSKVIFENGKYYVWYTYRNTPVKPIGMKRAHEANDTIPSADWDLSEIWYATSTDGFTWEEQGVAVARPPKGKLGWRSVTTPDILKWKGKYYLYFQAFNEPSGTRGDYCPVSVAWSESPDGPWHHTGKVVLENGSKGEWDQFAIHDPYPLVYHGKIYLYYKSDFDGNPGLVRMQGVATADNPEGPFKKYPLNPVINTGHETTLFPFKEGIAAFATKDGNEHFTIQYAPDGVNFEIASIVELMPCAAGPYVPDAFTNTKDGRGISWGICHLAPAFSWGKGVSILMRFDCDLSLDVDDPEFKQHEYYHLDPNYYYNHGLSKKQIERIKATKNNINNR